LAGTPANPDLILNNLCFNVTVINWPGDITIEGDFFQTDNIQIINCEGAITDNTGTVGAVSILSVDEPAVLGGLTIADRDSVGSTLVTNGIFDAANSVTGTHNGGDNSATALIDTTTNFVAAGVAVGESVYNTTDGSISTAITSITTTTNPNDTLNFVSFSCGTDDDFDDADSYEIVTGWRATQGATSEAGGQAGNAIQLVRLCGGLGGIRQEIAVVTGRIYEFTFYHKGTSTDSSPTFGQLALDSAAYETTSAADYAFWGTNQLANAAWTQYSTTFLAISDAVFINMLATYADPLYTLFDEVTLKEVTAGSLGVTGNLGVGTHSPAVKAHIQKQDTTNNAVVDIVRVDHLLESGTSAANGIGIGQVWHMPDAGGVEEQAAMDIFIEDITDGAEDVTIEWSVNSNGTLKPGIRIDGSGASIKIAIGAYGTPDAALAIPDNVKIAGAAPWFQIKETTGNTDFWFYVDPADGRLKVFNDNNATEVFTIQQDGDTKIAGDLVSNTYNFGADGEASDTYVITLDPAPAAYATGMMIVFTANTANTDGATLNVNALGAKTILKLHDEALETGDIEAGQVVVVVYDGTNMQMTSQLAQ